MNKRTVIATLERHADAIRARGVERLYLFGSTARGAARPESDVDLFIDVRRGARFSLIELIALRTYLSRLLRAHADVFTRRSLHRVIRRDVVKAAVRIL